MAVPESAPRAALPVREHGQPLPRALHAGLSEQESVGHWALSAPWPGCPEGPLESPTQARAGLQLLVPSPGLGNGEVWCHGSRRRDKPGRKATHS